MASTVPLNVPYIVANNRAALFALVAKRLSASAMEKYAIDPPRTKLPSSGMTFRYMSEDRCKYGKSITRIASRYIHIIFFFSIKKMAAAAIFLVSIIGAVVAAIVFMDHKIARKIRRMTKDAYNSLLGKKKTASEKNEDALSDYVETGAISAEADEGYSQAVAGQVSVDGDVGVQSGPTTGVVAQTSTIAGSSATSECHINDTLSSVSSLFMYAALSKDEKLKQMGVNQMLNICVRDLYESDKEPKCENIFKLLAQYETSSNSWRNTYGENYKYVDPEKSLMAETVPESACGIRDEFARSHGKDLLDGTLLYMSGAPACSGRFDQTSLTKQALQLAALKTKWDGDFEDVKNSFISNHKLLFQDFIDMGVSSSNAGFYETRGTWVDASTVSFTIGNAESTTVPPENVKLVFDIPGKPWKIVDVKNISRSGGTVTFKLAESVPQTQVIFMIPARMGDIMRVDQVNTCHERAKKFIAELVYHFDASKLSAGAQKWARRQKLCLGHLIRTGEDFCLFTSPAPGATVPDGLEEIDFSTDGWDDLSRAEFKQMLKEAHAKMSPEFKPATLATVEQHIGTKKVENLKKFNSMISSQSPPAWWMKVTTEGMAMFNGVYRNYRGKGDHFPEGPQNQRRHPELENKTYSSDTQFTTSSGGTTKLDCEFNQNYICTTPRTDAVGNERFVCPHQFIGDHYWQWTGRRNEGGTLVDCRAPLFKTESYSFSGDSNPILYGPEHLPRSIVN